MKREIHLVALPVLLVCYLVTGMGSAHADERSMSVHERGTHTASQDRGDKTINDVQPYWTNHKHKPARHGAGILDIVLVDVVSSGRATNPIFTRALTERPALLAGLADFLSGRAPPLSTI